MNTLTRTPRGLAWERIILHEILWSRLHLKRTVLASDKETIHHHNVCCGSDSRICFSETENHLERILVARMADWKVSIGISELWYREFAGIVLFNSSLGSGAYDEFVSLQSELATDRINTLHQNFMGRIRGIISGELPKSILVIISLNYRKIFEENILKFFDYLENSFKFSNCEINLKIIQIFEILSGTKILKLFPIDKSFYQDRLEKLEEGWKTQICDVRKFLGIFEKYENQIIEMNCENLGELIDELNLIKFEIIRIDNYIMTQSFSISVREKKNDLLLIIDFKIRNEILKFNENIDKQISERILTFSEFVSMDPVTDERGVYDAEEKVAGFLLELEEINIFEQFEDNLQFIANFVTIAEYLEIMNRVPQVIESVRKDLYNSRIPIERNFFERKDSILAGLEQISGKLRQIEVIDSIQNESNLLQLKEIYQHLKQIEELKNELTQSEIYLGWENSEWGMCENLRSRIEPLIIIWSVIEELGSNEKIWKYSEMNSINYVNIENEIQTLTRDIGGLEVSDNRLIQQIKDKVESIEQVVPLVKYLNSNRLSHDDWEASSEVIGFDMAAGHSFSLQTLIDQGVMEFIGDIQEIYGKVHGDDESDSSVSGARSGTRDIYPNHTQEES
jgi:hypothetical protein